MSFEEWHWILTPCVWQHSMEKASLEFQGTWRVGRTLGSCDQWGGTMAITANSYNVHFMLGCSKCFSCIDSLNTTAYKWSNIIIPILWRRKQRCLCLVSLPHIPLCVSEGKGIESCCLSAESVLITNAGEMGKHWADIQNDKQWHRVGTMDRLGRTIGSNECCTEDFILCLLPWGAFQEVSHNWVSVYWK